VDASIIPQVLKYAFWTESNPDSIKSLWYECDNKPEDLTIAWDSFKVRILIIAPRILRSALDIKEKITYDVELVEVNRWVEGKNTILLVTKRETEEKTPRPKTVKGLQAYDEDFYMAHYNKQSVQQFFTYVKETEAIVKTHMAGPWRENSTNPTAALRRVSSMLSAFIGSARKRSLSSSKYPKETQRKLESPSPDMNPNGNGLCPLSSPAKPRQRSTCRYLRKLIRKWQVGTEKPHNEYMYPTWRNSAAPEQCVMVSSERKKIYGC
jgi:hypothetical protein